MRPFRRLTSQHCRQVLLPATVGALIEIIRPLMGIRDMSIFPTEFIATKLIPGLFLIYEMKTILIVMLGITTALVIVLLFRNYFVNRELRKFLARKYSILQSLVGKLEKQEHLNDAEILALAQDPSTRHVLFHILVAHKKRHLFPAQFYSFEKAAESYLVNWLEYPTELNAAPDEIELLKKITLVEDGKDHDYYVFKFRVYKHWAAASGWMTGTAGPYYENSLPFDLPRGTYSNFNKLGNLTPDEEADWVHYNITLKK